MANTPNINLVKPLGTDKALVSVLNDNSDKIDSFAGSTNTSIGKVESGMAIVVNGNTAPRAISAGQYLFIKNHSTLSAGGYHATANIANGATITSSNVSADSDGIVNGAFSELNSKIANYELGSFSTVASLETALTTAISGMSVNETKWISFTFTATTGVFHYAKYRGYILRSTGATPSAGAAIVLNTGVYDACGYYNGSSYTWDGLVDKIANIVTAKDFNSESITINANSKKDFTITIDSTLKGLNPRGIVKIDYSGSNTLCVCKYSIYSNTVYLSVFNPTSSNITTTYTITVLYHNL